MKARGFTLIELSLVIVLIGILTAAALPVLLPAFKAFFQQQETAQVEREAMLAIERVAREVRMSQAFAPAGSSITFERSDGSGGTVTVTIAQDGGNLVLTRGGTTSTLARDVSGTSFALESYEGACYVNASFSTGGIDNPWRVVTYTRNETC